MNWDDVATFAVFALMVAFIVSGLRQGERVKPDRDARDNGPIGGGDVTGRRFDGH